MPQIRCRYCITHLGREYLRLIIQEIRCFNQKRYTWIIINPILYFFWDHFPSLESSRESEKQRRFPILWKIYSCIANELQRPMHAYVWSKVWLFFSMFHFGADSFMWDGCMRFFFSTLKGTHVSSNSKRADYLRSVQSNWWWNCAPLVQIKCLMIR